MSRFKRSLLGLNDDLTLGLRLGGTIGGVIPLTLNAFATGPGGVSPIFSGRGEQNSGLVLVSGSGKSGEVVQGRMVAADNSLDWLASGQTLAQFHSAIIANDNNRAVGAGTQEGGFKSLADWLVENPSASVTDNQLNLADQTYYAVGVDFSNVRLQEFGSGAFYALACRFGGNNQGQVIQWDFSSEWIIELRHCDIVGPGDGTGASPFIRRRDGGDNTGRLIAESCDFWGFAADMIQIRGGDKVLFNRFDAPTSLTPTAVAYVAGTYQIGDVVVAPGSDPTVATKSWINTVAGNTASPIFTPSESGNGWTLRDIHGDTIVMRAGDDETTEVFGNVLNTDRTRRFHTNSFYGAMNSALWGKTQGDYTNVICKGNLVMTNPAYNGGTPCSNLSNAIVAFNRIETRAGIENGIWLGVVVQAPVRIQGNTDPRYDDAPLSLSAVTVDEDYVVITSETAETGDTMVARTGELLPHIYEGTYADIATVDGSGYFEGWIEGAPRGFYALKAQVRYRDVENPAAMTSNTCFVGWVFMTLSQSDLRGLGDTNHDDSSEGLIPATPGINVRVITLQRNTNVAPVTAENLLPYDIVGNAPAGRPPIWAFGNALGELITTAPIVVAACQVSGSSTASMMNDAVLLRFFSDDALIANAAQPHLVPGERPAVWDLVFHAFTSSEQYNGTTTAVEAIGAMLTGLDPSGDPLEIGSSQNYGGVTWIHDHSLAELVDWTHSRVAFIHAKVDHMNAEAGFIGHPVYGSIVAPLGFPQQFTLAHQTNGSMLTNTLIDGSHPSQDSIGGMNHLMRMAAASMARAVGAWTPPKNKWDRVYWPVNPGDDPKYVHVAIEGVDITTWRKILANDDPPVTVGDGGTAAEVFGEAYGWRINGVRTRNTLLVSFGGQVCVRIGKPDGSNLTNADVLAWDAETLNTYTDISPNPIDPLIIHRTLSKWQDFAVVETGLPTVRAIPIQSRVDAGLFTNLIPEPVSTLSLDHVVTLSAENVSSTPVSFGSVPSDGRPLLLALGTIGSSNNSTPDLNYPTSISLGGVDLLGTHLARNLGKRVKASLYYVAAPAVGNLELIATIGGTGFTNVVQAFHVEGGAGVGAVTSQGGAAGPTAATTLTAEANGSMLVNVIATDVDIVGVTNGAFATPISTVGVLDLGVATVITNTGGSPTSFTLSTFEDRVILGVEILAPV